MNPGLFQISIAVVYLSLACLPYARADDSPAGGRSTSRDTQAQVSPSQSIANYEQEIRKREAEHGVYDPATGEFLLSVGLVYQNDGRHEEAVDAFARALQIKRVNEGLQGIGQLLILEQLIKSNIAEADWEEVDRNYQQLLWIHKRNYDADDPRLLPVVDKVGRWKLKAYKENLLDGSAIRIIGESEKLF
ncbi:MAG: tetratricopeptide repeat protein, partial [Gammaproteobacteria bacterium]|nr:tetratricopeptide repeat protein [Gammaproteobacteria bacterium]